MAPGVIIMALIMLNERAYFGNFVQIGVGQQGADKNIYRKKYCSEPQVNPNFPAKITDLIQ